MQAKSLRSKKKRLLSRKNTKMSTEKLPPVKERLNFPNLLESFKMLDMTNKFFRSLRMAVILFSMTALIAGCATQQSASVKSAEETKLITDIVTMT